MLATVYQLSILYFFRFHVFNTVLIFNVVRTSASIVNFEHVIAGWVGNKLAMNCNAMTSENIASLPQQLQL